MDDHPLVRESLRNLINKQLDMSVCGEAGSAPQALSAIQELQPAVAIVDLTLAGGSGIELIKDLKVHCPRVSSIVLSMHDESLYAERVLRAGARGYVMKRESTGSILKAVRRVAGGGIYISDSFSDWVAERMVSNRKARTGEYSAAETLSDRELEVFCAFGRGKGTAQIAAELHLSSKTVQAYCKRIKDKLGLANFHEMIREAVRFVERAAGTS